MSSVHNKLSTRLFVQAAITGLFAFLDGGGTGWLLLTLVLAGAAAGLGLALRGEFPQARMSILGFEGVAILLGAVGLVSGHYIPGTIVGIVTIITVAQTPQSAFDGVAPVPYTAAAAQAPPEQALPAGAYGVQPVMVGAPVQPHAQPAQPMPQPVAAQPVAPQVPVQPFAQPDPQPVAPVAAGRWAPDPSGRHHYRWWDGRAWTHHVSTNGVAGVDGG